MGLSAFASFAPLLDFLRPSKSPYLVASIFGAGSIVGASHPLYDMADERFWLVAIPIYITLYVIVLFSFVDRGTAALSDDEVDNQYKFSRALGISTALLAVSMAAILIVQSDLLFHIAYLCALVQLATFLIYTGIRIVQEEQSARYRIFEISFIMFMLLLVGVFCFSNISLDDGSFLYVVRKQGAAVIDRFAVTSLVVMSCWAVYQIFWIRRIFKVLEFKVRDG